MLYKTGIVASGTNYDFKDIREVISTFFPNEVYISPANELEKQIVEYLDHYKIDYFKKNIYEADIILIFWNKTDKRCKSIINQAYKLCIPTLIFYERKIS